MTSIAIDKHQGVIYEGDGSLGRPILPTPVITPAKIIFESTEPLTAEINDNNFGYRFREDSYDPVSRIRRGRFYFADSGPREWTIPEHPAIPRVGTNVFGATRKFLDTFGRRSIWHEYINGKDEQALVLLGVDNRFTIWTIINIEVISTGEELITLKARTSLGVLPRIDTNKIPSAFRARVMQSLNAFRDEVYRSGPVSVIDRARDAASQILLAYFGLEGKASKDLSDLINMLDGEKNAVIQSSAKIIARFHARAKPVVQQKHEPRAIREQDAELATQCIGAILCDLGWADWV